MKIKYFLKIFFMMLLGLSTSIILPGKNTKKSETKNKKSVVVNNSDDDFAEFGAMVMQDCKQILAEIHGKLIKIKSYMQKLSEVTNDSVSADNKMFAPIVFLENGKFCFSVEDSLIEEFKTYCIFQEELDQSFNQIGTDVSFERFIKGCGKLYEIIRVGDSPVARSIFAQIKLLFQNNYQGDVVDRLLNKLYDSTINYDINIRRFVACHYHVYLLKSIHANISGISEGYKPLMNISETIKKALCIEKINNSLANFFKFAYLTIDIKPVSPGSNIEEVEVRGVGELTDELISKSGMLYVFL